VNLILEESGSVTSNVQESRYFYIRVYSNQKSFPQRYVPLNKIENFKLKKFSRALLFELSQFCKSEESLFRETLLSLPRKIEMSKRTNPDRSGNENGFEPKTSEKYASTIPLALRFPARERVDPGVVT